jgi:hypothetical protein
MSKFEDLSVILKLVSGETVICQVLSDTEKNMLVRDPYEIRVHSVATQEGVQSTTYYADWFLSSKSRIHMIRKEHVISAAIPDDDTKKHYFALVARRDGDTTPSALSPNWEQQFNFGDTEPDRN